MSERHFSALDPADLDRTAELPVLDRDALREPRTSPELSSTDTWSVIPPPELASLEAGADAAQRAAMQAELAQAREGQSTALKRVADLEHELAQMRGALEKARVEIDKLNRRAAMHSDPPGTGRALENRLAERDRALEAAERRLEDLGDQLSAHREALHTVEGRRTVLESLLRGLHSDVSERDTRVAQLEAQIKAKDALLCAAQGHAPAGEPVASAIPELRSACLELFRLDTSEPVVHVLGHRTRIGRTPDNDIRLGTRFVSRHHAMILVGGGQTIIEDLNSTNGVRVNGWRVQREILHDGDEIDLGQARFQLRSRGIV